MAWLKAKQWFRCEYWSPSYVSFQSNTNGFPASRLKRDARLHIRFASLEPILHDWNAIVCVCVLVSYVSDERASRTLNGEVRVPQFPPVCLRNVDERILVWCHQVLVFVLASLVQRRAVVNFLLRSSRVFLFLLLLRLRSEEQWNYSSEHENDGDHF